MTSLSDLIERVEGLFLQYAREAARPEPSPYRESCRAATARAAAAEYAAILASLRALQEKDIEHG